MEYDWEELSMKRIIAAIMALMLLLTAIPSIATEYRDYPGISPYDTTGIIPQETLDQFAKTHKILYDATGLKVVCYFVLSFDGLEPSEYASIISKVRESMIGDIENEMLILVNVQDSIVYVSKGSGFDTFLSDEEVEMAIKTAEGVNVSNGFQYAGNAWGNIVSTLSDNIKKAGITKSQENSDAMPSNTYNLDGFIVSLNGFSLSNSYMGLTLNVKCTIENTTDQTLNLMASNVVLNGWMINNVGCAVQVAAGAKSNAIIYLNAIDDDAQITSADELESLSMTLSSTNSAFMPVSSQNVTVSFNK